MYSNMYPQSLCSSRAYVHMPASAMQSRRARGTVALELPEASPPEVPGLVQWHSDKYADEIKLCEALLQKQYEGRPEWKKLWEWEEYEKLRKKYEEEPADDSPWILVKGEKVPGIEVPRPFWYNCDTGESLRLDAGDPRVREARHETHVTKRARRERDAG